LKSQQIHFSSNSIIALSLFVYNKNSISNMRSQLILAMLATAITAAPVLTTGDAKVSSLFRYSLHRRRLMPVVLTHHPQASQLSKREAAPGDSLIGEILDNGDASVRTAVLSVGSGDCTNASNRERPFRSARLSPVSYSTMEKRL
jgi:hypothetical protein